jgi:atypical dual specificity phosphatase
MTAQTTSLDGVKNVNFTPETPAIKLNPHELKVSSVFKRVIQSRLVQTLATIGVSLGFVFSATKLSAAAVIAGITIVPLHLFYGAVILAAALTLGSIYLMRKELLYEVSLWKTVLGNKMNPDKNPWCNEIIDGLFLGAQPMLNLNHPSELTEKGITSILTLLETDHEFGMTLFTEAVQPQDWAKLGIEQKIIESPDFLPVSQEKIEEAVEFIREKLGKGEPVYVHCKAGRGRSATAVICYLLKYGIENPDKTTTRFSSVQEAIEFVKGKRNAININPRQRKAIEQYFKNLI